MPIAAADRIDACLGAARAGGPTTILRDFDDAEIEWVVDDVLRFRRQCVVGPADRAPLAKVGLL